MNFAVRSSTWLELKKKHNDANDELNQQISFSTIHSSCAAASVSLLGQFSWEGPPDLHSDHPYLSLFPLGPDK